MDGGSSTGAGSNPDVDIVNIEEQAAAVGVELADLTSTEALNDLANAAETLEGTSTTILIEIVTQENLDN